MLNRRSKQLHWQWPTLRILTPAILTLLLFVGAYLFFVLPMLEESLLNTRKQMLKELTRTAWQLLAHYEERTQTGELSLEDAQSRAIERIRSLRYGEDGKDYFWINGSAEKVGTRHGAFTLAGRSDIGSSASTSHMTSD